MSGSFIPARIFKRVFSWMPDIGTACRIADALGICVRELCPDEEQYAVFIKKDTLAKLIVISEINGVEPDELIASILEKGIEENGFYD